MARRTRETTKNMLASGLWLSGRCVAACTLELVCVAGLAVGGAGAPINSRDNNTDPDPVQPRGRPGTRLPLCIATRSAVTDWQHLLEK